ncbi:MAG: phosphatidylserine decarboxylase family protein [Bacteroidales bacterium]|nr:phosphatidylserine decarboxylase family protein [Bacteroidales bacterium]
MIRIHKEGRTVVAISVLLLAGINILMVLFLDYRIFTILSIASVVLLVLLIRFFRNPDRRFVQDERLIVAPADGRIVAVEKVRVSEFFQEERIQVSIFMSIHDVHVNYYPIEGRIIYQKYHPGKYLVARHPKSSELNEHASVGIKNGDLSILVRQIAGFVARRVKCYAEVGKSVRQGEELGFIKFGSRVDLFIPHDKEILVKLHESVIGGVTPIARIK